MDSVMHVLAQVVLLVVLATYLGLVAVLAAAVVWAAFHMVRDHWSVAQAWHEAEARLRRRR